MEGDVAVANDRVFIKCKTCGCWKMLLKFFPTDGLTTRDNGILEWLDAHRRCHPLSYAGGLEGDPGYTLHTEDDETLDFAKQNMTPEGKQINTRKDL